eukprot:518776_1
MVFDHWDDDPFHLDLYKNRFVLFFDIITLSTASVIVTIIFSIWIYQLFFALTKKNKKIKSNTPDLGRVMSLESMGSFSSTDGSNKNKPKVDLSLPTLTVQKSTEPSKSNESKTPEPTPEAMHIIQPSTQTPIPMETELSKSNLSKTNFTSNHSKSNDNDTSRNSKSPRPHSTKNSKKHKIKKHQAINPISKILTTVCITLALLFLYSLTLIVLFTIMNKYPDCIYISLCFELIYTQRLCLYLYYIFRAYDTFQGTVHKFKKQSILCIIASICVPWICGQIFYFIFNSVVYSCTEFSVMIAIVPLAMTETYASTFCVMMFIFKLKKVYKKNLGQQNLATKKLEYLLTKLTILAATTITSTIIIMSVYPFTFALGLLGIDTPVNIICLVLSFGFYDAWYKVLCNPCRRCFERKYSTESVNE